MDTYIQDGTVKVVLSADELREGRRLVAMRIAELRDNTEVVVLHDLGAIATVRIRLDSGDEMDLRIDPLNLWDRALSARRLH